jgi:hypothetical protein
LGIDLAVVDLRREDATALYEAELLLVRPDQIVAWRGGPDEGCARSILRDLMGHATAPALSASAGVRAAE